jgi:predicted nucleic acid-binding protein
VSAPSFVIDASVALAWCLPDEQPAYAASVIHRLRTEDAIAPALWPVECLNALLAAEKRKRLQRSDVERLIGLLREPPIGIDYASVQIAFGNIAALARDYSLSVYDASYLELAIRLRLPLASLDEPLIRAAKKCGVAILKP